MELIITGFVILFVILLLLIYTNLDNKKLDEHQELDDKEQLESITQWNERRSRKDKM